jgi:predicted MFS family arabinose efflux permease
MTNPHASTRMPAIVPLLAVGTFLMCTTEYIVAGLINEMSADFGVTTGQIGLLITAFAIGMIIGAPVMAVATLRLPRRGTLVLALVVFALGHVIAALSDSYGIVFIARVITALATGTFWSVASVVATTAAGPQSASKALGVMMSGVGLATVVGVPLGSFAGQIVGWRGAFVGLAALAVAAAVVIRVLAPEDEDRQAPSARAEMRALRNRPTWLLAAATVLVTGAYMGAFSYVAPLLTERTGLAQWAVPLVLVGFGIGSLVGTNVGGRLGDRSPIAALIGATVGVAAVLALLIPLSTIPVLAIALIVLLGVVGMAVPPLATGLSVRFAPHAPTLAAAVAVAAFNAGTAISSSVGGAAIDSPVGPTGPAVIGVVMAALALIPLAAIRARKNTSISLAEAPHASAAITNGVPTA